MDTEMNVNYSSLEIIRFSNFSKGAARKLRREYPAGKYTIVEGWGKSISSDADRIFALYTDSGSRWERDNYTRFLRENSSKMDRILPIMKMKYNPDKTRECYDSALNTVRDYVAMHDGYGLEVRILFQRKNSDRLFADALSRDLGYRTKEFPRGSVPEFENGTLTVWVSCINDAQWNNIILDRIFIFPVIMCLIFVVASDIILIPYMMASSFVIFITTIVSLELSTFRPRYITIFYLYTVDGLKIERKNRIPLAILYGVIAVSLLTANIAIILYYQTG